MRLTYLVSTTAESRQAAMSYDLLRVVDVNDFDNNERERRRRSNTRNNVPWNIFPADEQKNNKGERERELSSRATCVVHDSRIGCGH